MRKNQLFLKIMLYPYVSFFLLTMTTELFKTFSLSKYYLFSGIISMATYCIIGCFMGDLVEILMPVNKLNLRGVAIAGIIPLIPILSFILRLDIFPVSFYAKYFSLFLFLFGFYFIIFIKMFARLKKE